MTTTIRMPEEIMKTLSAMPGGTKYQGERILTIFVQQQSTKKQRMIASLRAIREKVFGETSEKIVFAVEKITTIVNPNFYKFEGKKKELALDMAALSAAVALALGGLVMLSKLGEMGHKDNAEVAAIVKEAVRNEIQSQEKKLTPSQQHAVEVGMAGTIHRPKAEKSLLFNRDEEFGDIAPSVLR